MIIAKIRYTSEFIRELKKLTHDKRLIASKKEKLFKQNPFAQILRTHKLTGKLEGFWSFSVNYQDRIIFRFISDNEVIFYKIGNHDIYK